MHIYLHVFIMISEFTKINHTRTESQVYYGIAGKRDTVFISRFRDIFTEDLATEGEKKEINKNKVKKTAKKDRNIINTR